MINDNLFKNKAFKIQKKTTLYFLNKLRTIKTCLKLTGSYKKKACKTHKTRGDGVIGTTIKILIWMVGKGGEGRD